MLEKTLESPLDYKEIQPVHPKGNWPWIFIGSERITGRKARVLQTEEIGCKCQTFLSLLSGRRKQTSDIFFLLYTNLKGGFSLNAVLPWHLVSPEANFPFFLMEMFVLSYVNVPQTLSSSSTKWLRTYLTNLYVILRYCSPNLCKWNYLYGNLPFYKIQVNHFMVWDELSGTILRFKTFLSFINRLLVTI